MKDSLTNTLELLTELRIAAGKVRNMRFIANSSIPKHKQAKFDRLVTKAIVGHRNAKSAFEAGFNRLSTNDKRLVISSASL